MPDGVLQAEFIALRAQAADDADRDIREIGMVTERLATMHVRDMNFDHRFRDRGKRVGQRHRRMRIGSRVDHDAVRIVTRGVQPVDQLMFGVRLAEVNLELKVTETPAPVLYRDCLSLSQMIDHWSLLQIPINLMISLPKMKFRGHTHMPLPEFQAQWLRQVLMMCLSKERISGIYCDGWGTDGPDSNTDLISQNGQPTLALQVLHELCGEYCS